MRVSLTASFVAIVFFALVADVESQLRGLMETKSAKYFMMTQYSDPVCGTVPVARIYYKLNECVASTGNVYVKTVSMFLFPNKNRVTLTYYTDNLCKIESTIMPPMVIRTFSGTSLEKTSRCVRDPSEAFWMSQVISVPEMMGSLYQRFQLTGPGLLMG